MRGRSVNREAIDRSTRSIRRVMGIARWNGDAGNRGRPVGGEGSGHNVDAIKEVHRLLCRGYTDVVDADLSKYFDTIPAELLRCVARRIVDGEVSRGCDSHG